MNPVQTEKQARWTVFPLGEYYGSLEFQELQDVEQMLLHLAAVAEPACLLFDMENTEYFGSAFIGVLLRCYKKVVERGARFALCRVCPELRSELETTRLDSVIEIYDSREAAFRALSRPEASQARFPHQPR